MLSTSPSSGIVFLDPFAATRVTVKVASLSAVTRKSAESFRTTSSVPILIPAKEESAGVTTPASVTAEAVTLRPAIWSSSHSCFCCVAFSTGLKLEMKRGSSLMTVERMSERSRFLFWKL